MFLTPDQRRRKEGIKRDQARKRKAIDAANKLLSDRAQRDAWAHSASCAITPGTLYVSNQVACTGLAETLPLWHCCV